MSNVVVVDKLPSFSKRLSFVMNDAIKEASRDGLINARIKAPYSGTKKMRSAKGLKGRGGAGHLKSDSKNSRVKMMHWRISFWKEYARFQELGGDGKRVVRKYTTAGTGAHFLKNAGDEQAKKLIAKFKKHGSRVKV